MKVVINFMELEDVVKEHVSRKLNIHPNHITQIRFYEGDEVRFINKVECEPVKKEIVTYDSNIMFSDGGLA